MFGRQPGHIVGITAVDIHGALFYDITFALESAPQLARTSRIGTESVYENPREGDAVVLHVVMGQLTKVEQRDT
jgi:hypothetical protein